MEEVTTTHTSKSLLIKAFVKNVPVKANCLHANIVPLLLLIWHIQSWRKDLGNGTFQHEALPHRGPLML